MASVTSFGLSEEAENAFFKERAQRRKAAIGASGGIGELPLPRRSRARIINALAASDVLSLEDLRNIEFVRLTGLSRLGRTGLKTLLTALAEVGIVKEKEENPRYKRKSVVVWRVGSKVPLNVYEGDRPVCQCHSAKDAERIVAAMNEIEWLRMPEDLRPLAE